MTFHSYAYALARREFVLAGDEPPRLLSAPEQLLEIRRMLKGEAQDDPTHSALLGMILMEKLREAKVEGILVYPGHPHEKYKTSADFLSDRLKAKTPN